MNMRHWCRKNWHKLICRLFKEHFQEVLTNALHPDFGWVWGDDEQGGKLLKQVYKQGYEQAQRDFLRDGLKGWGYIDPVQPKV